MEISTQSPRPRIAAGDPAAIAGKCEDYHREADQAEAMARRLRDLVRAYELPGVHSWSYLVVTDQALPTNPALAAALRRVRPTRNPRFVCSIEEFELLVDAGIRGWSVPSLVRGWQTSHTRAVPRRPPAPQDAEADPAGGRDTKPFDERLARRAPHRRPAGRLRLRQGTRSRPSV